MPMNAKAASGSTQITHPVRDLNRTARYFFFACPGGTQPLSFFSRPGGQKALSPLAPILLVESREEPELVPAVEPEDVPELPGT